MPSSARASLQYVPEATYGVTPSSAAGTPIRFTSETLAFATDYTDSAEIRSDRGQGRGVATGGRATGDISVEIIPGDLDDLLQYLCGASSWADPAASVALSAATTTGYTAAAAVTLPAGAWIFVAGFDTQTNNGWRRVSSAVTNATAIPVDGGATVEMTAATYVRGTSIRGNDTTLHSISVEKFLADASDSLLLRGCRVGSFSAEVAPGSIATATIGLLGRDQQHHTTRQLTAGTATTARPANAIEDARAFVDGSPYDDLISISMELNANLRELAVIGVFGSKEVNFGRASANGSIQAVTNDLTLLDDAIARNAVRVSIAIGSYLFDFPQVDFTSSELPITGLDTDIALQLDWQASVTGGTMWDIYRSE